MNSKSHIILHHSAVSRTKNPDQFNAIDQYHKSKGWGGIGYHYCINPAGTVRVGRLDNEAGAHCRESLMNYRSIGICIEGDFDIEQPTQAQVDQCKNLVGRLMKEYGIKSENVSGHRKYATYKSCPGIYFPDSLIKEIALGINGQDTPSDWAKSEWQEMVDLGIMTKNPKAFITKEELAVVIKRLKKLYEKT
jgi:N-acetyl-anhydromuramyl-L-alanine amidase AmpD